VVKGPRGKVKMKHRGRGACQKIEKKKFKKTKRGSLVLRLLRFKYPRSHLKGCGVRVNELGKREILKGKV